MKKLLSLTMVIFALSISLTAASAQAGDDHPGEKPKPTLYSHEEGEEGDESLIRDEGLFVVAGVATAIATLGFMLYRRGKTED